MLKPVMRARKDRAALIPDDLLMVHDPEFVPPNGSRKILEVMLESLRDGLLRSGIQVISVVDHGKLVCGFDA